MYTRFHVFTSFAQRFRHKAYMRLNGFANIAWSKALGKLAKHGREDSHFLFPPVVCTYLRAFPNKACFVPFSTKWRRAHFASTICTRALCGATGDPAPPRL